MKTKQSDKQYKLEDAIAAIREARIAMEAVQAFGDREDAEARAAWKQLDLATEQLGKFNVKTGDRQ